VIGEAIVSDSGLLDGKVVDMQSLDGVYQTSLGNVSFAIPCPRKLFANFFRKDEGKHSRKRIGSS
jgi:hypothetical protein